MSRALVSVFSLFLPADTNIIMWLLIICSLLFNQRYKFRKDEILVWKIIPLDFMEL